MIKFENVSFSYDKLILDNLNLNIDKNKITMIIGINGSGKTTLSNLMSGLLIANKGTILIDDLLLNKKTNVTDIRKKIGMVLQNPNNQILFTKVFDDISFTLENMNCKKEDMSNIIKDSLKKVDMLNYINDNPYKLSGGQKQRIAIASQLALNPDYLILDESTSQLDINGKKSIYKLIKKLKKDIGIIFITNDINEIIYADDLIIIDSKKTYKYDLNDILNDNSILTKHKLDIPFIIKICNKLNIKNKNMISEERILNEI